MSIVVGLALPFLWRWLTFLEWHFFSLFPEASFPSPYMGFIVFALWHLLAFFFMARCASSIPEKWHRPILWLSAFCMSVAWLPAASNWGDFSLLKTFLFPLLPAWGSAALLLAWLWRLCGIAFYSGALTLGFAFTLGSAVLFFLGEIPRWLVFGGVVALPFVAVLLWSPPPEDNFPEPSLSSQRAGAFPMRLVLRVAVFFSICAIFHSMLLTQVNENTVWVWKMTDPLYGVGALVVGLFFYSKATIDLRKIYLLAQTALGLGLILNIAVGEEYSIVPVGLLQLGFGIFGAYVFNLFIYLGIRTGRKNALVVSAQSQALITASVLLGLVLSELAVFWMQATTLPFQWKSSLLGLVLLLLANFFLHDDKETFAGYDLLPPEQELPEAGRTPEAEARLQSRLLERSFSLQEIKVALMVTEGLSNLDMALNLNITANTLRTHLKNIHKKMESSDRENLRQRLEFLKNEM
ncbi:MAG: hypothetical protein GX256_06495 [Fretibacterium sp.]|nr:hypothetical protein [Fretibacterium sp.]